MSDLQALLNRLNSTATLRTTSFHEPSVATEAPTPLSQEPEPTSASTVLSPNLPAEPHAPQAEPNARAANLLNLLNLSQSTTSSPQPARVSSTTIVPASTEMSGGHVRDRTTSATDLVASFFRKPSSASKSTSIASPGATKSGEVSTSKGGSSQAYLLNLLNSAKPSLPGRSDSGRAQPADVPIQTIEERVPEAVVDDLAQDLADASLEQTTASPQVERKPSPLRRFGSQEPGQQDGFEAPKSSKKGIFSYVNPFEQLSASSPRASTPVHHTNLLTAQVREVDQTLLPGLSQQASRESLTKRSKMLPEKTDREVAEDLYNSAAGAVEDLPTPVIRDIEQAVVESARDITEELKDEKTRKMVEQKVGKEAADVLGEVAQEIAGGPVVDSWESAEAEQTAREQQSAVRVYNFPMKPFVSLDISKDLEESKMTFKDDASLAIARTKKDFDQNDRTLVDASNQYIAYVSPKVGGVRIVSQEDGTYKNVFSSQPEAIVNLALCNSPSSSNKQETLLATGVQGSVFWVHLSGDYEKFEDNLDARSVTFPAFPAGDDNTSGGQLKTRARRSSRHPDLFAVGRGKAIHIIWPFVASNATFTDRKTRKCNSQAYLEHSGQVIATGKAGKDFAFSQCDTVIASLDKTGKVKFWDITDVIDPSAIKPKEIRKPILTISTTDPADKSWPTSVMFLDKERQFHKGYALRYLLIGMKQNHTLQLWDLLLQKAVQEINLPHANESDGICSVVYDAASSIITVGHPTRNSIYFIHLSAPRYSLPVMKQAKFLTRVADGDTSLPKVESTAIMTGIRELCFTPFGQLRSLEILAVPHSSKKASNEDRVLFELYAMHSKGVVRLSVKPEHLGWNSKDEVIHGINAEETGAVLVSDLKSADTIEPSEASINNDPPARTTTDMPIVRDFVVARKDMSPARPREIVQPEPFITRTLTEAEPKLETAKLVTTNGTGNVKSQLEPTPSKKKKKAANTAVQVTPVPVAQVQTASYAKAASTPVRALTSPHRNVVSMVASPNVGGPPRREETPPISRSLEDNITTSIAQLFNRELDLLYRKVDEDKRVQDAASAAKQDAILRLVSSTLTDNVEKSLTRIVQSGLQQELLPTVAAQVSNVLATKLQDIGQEVQLAVGMHHKPAVIDAIGGKMQDPQFQAALGDAVAKRVTAHIDGHLSTALNKSITPAFTNLTVTTVQQIARDMQQRIVTAQQGADTQRHNDSLKIDQLTGLVRSLTETVKGMAAAQGELQRDIQLLQRHVAASGPGSSHRGAGAGSRELAPAPEPVEIPALPAKTAEQIEIEGILTSLEAGEFEATMTRFVSSERKTELFNRVLWRVDPTPLSTVGPLVALSVAAAVSEPWDDKRMERVSWLEVVVGALDIRHPDVRPLAERILDIIATRLQTLYMEISQTRSDPSGVSLRRVFEVHSKFVQLQNTVSQG